MEDNSVIPNVEQGKEVAFKALVDNALPRIRTLLTHQYHLQEADMDDVIQVASNKAWTKMNDFRGDSKFITWFYIIVRNEVVNLLKRKNNIEKREVSLRPTFNESEGDYEYILSEALDKKLDENAASLIQQKENIDAYKIVIDNIMGNLSDSHRQIIQMVFEEELSYKEIAEILNIPIGTVMSRLFFARKHAQKLISKYAKQHDIQLDCLGKGG